MGTLSVRENIAFSATLRLPSVYTWANRQERVCQVIEELGLTEVADSKVSVGVNSISVSINYCIRLEQNLSEAFLGEKRNALALEWN